AWVRPIAALRTRGIGSVVVTIDAAAADRIERAARERLGERLPAPDPAVEEQRAQRVRALRHALAEYELRVHQVTPGASLSGALSA
ncbi:MAG TPA: hypothetical protein VIL50_07790, partial [Candidatus Limnocylindrales bacterium]